jgi:type IV pilus assembly protein PilW
MKRFQPKSPQARAYGLSLIELMIAMVLGLLVVGAAIGIFASNKQAFRSTESLGVVQENVRTSFELMARDIREAGGNPCVNTVPIANVVNSDATSWWSNFTNWGSTVQGYGATVPFPNAGFGTGAAARLSGTDAVQLISGDNDVVTISAHDTAGGSFTLNRADHGIAAGDLVLVCNSRQASVFQVGGVSGAVITYGAGGAPGNCSANLGLVGEGEACSTRAPFAYAAPNSVLVKLHASRWFIANNASGRPSLYQTRLSGSGPDTQEVAEGVSAMTVTYLLDDGTDYLPANHASLAGNWARVIAARVNMTLEGTPNTGTGGVPVQRQLIHVVSLRNRNL